MTAGLVRVAWSVVVSPGLSYVVFYVVFTLTEGTYIRGEEHASILMGKILS